MLAALCGLCCTAHGQKHLEAATPQKGGARAEAGATAGGAAQGGEPANGEGPETGADAQPDTHRPAQRPPAHPAPQKMRRSFKRRAFPILAYQVKVGQPLDVTMELGDSGKVESARIDPAALAPLTREYLESWLRTFAFPAEAGEYALEFSAEEVDAARLAPASMPQAGAAKPKPATPHK